MKIYDQLDENGATARPFRKRRRDFTVCVTEGTMGEDLKRCLVCGLEIRKGEESTMYWGSNSHQACDDAIVAKKKVKEESGK